ncbi:hypothetical protein EY01_15790, partial [Staphylococcus aureus]
QHAPRPRVTTPGGHNNRQPDSGREGRRLPSCARCQRLCVLGATPRFDCVDLMRRWARRATRPEDLELPSAPTPPIAVVRQTAGK